MIGYKTSLNKFKKTEITSSIFFDHDVMKLEINYKKKTEKHTNTRRLNNVLLNNKWVNNEKKPSKDMLREMEIKAQWPKIYGIPQKQSQERNSWQYRPTSKNKKKSQIAT